MLLGDESSLNSLSFLDASAVKKEDSKKDWIGENCRFCEVFMEMK